MQVAFLRSFPYTLKGTVMNLLPYSREFRCILYKRGKWMHYVNENGAGVQLVDISTSKGSPIGG